MESRTRGVLDTPLSRSMTAFSAAAAFTAFQSSLRGALATKQSSSSLRPLDCFAGARNDDAETLATSRPSFPPADATPDDIQAPHRCRGARREPGGRLKSLANSGTSRIL